MTDTRTETRDRDADQAMEPISTEDIAATQTPRVDRNGVTGTDTLPSTQEAEADDEAPEPADTAEPIAASEPLATTERAAVTERASAADREDDVERHEAVEHLATEPSRQTNGRPDTEQSPLFDEATSRELRERWTDVQTGFVDEPRSSVEHADALVADVMRRLAESFAAERKTLEGQWSRGDDVSTEDLRVALQRYRSFFDRLLSI